MAFFAELIFAVEGFSKNFADLIFAVDTSKTMEKPTGRIVGHLPFEVARCVKFLLQRGAIIDAKLSSTDYRRSPLIQGGLEIPCNVIVKMPPTLINKKIIERLDELLDVLYVEPDGSAVIGSFLHNSVDYPSEPEVRNARKGKKRIIEDNEETAAPVQQRPIFVKDIRTYFSGDKSSTKKSKAPKRPKCVIEID